MLKIDFLVSYYMETVGVKSPGLINKFVKLSDTLIITIIIINIIVIIIITTVWPLAWDRADIILIISIMIIVIIRVSLNLTNLKKMKV